MNDIEIKNGNTHLILIYPSHADFKCQLHFKYEEELKIDIIPFDFQDETASLKLYEGLFLANKLYSTFTFVQLNTK
jgi:hypothetical protein